MGIDKINAVGGMPVGKTMAVAPVDSASKSIENKISDAQRQMQELSSKRDISEQEKMEKRKELQQEISTLNTELRQRQTEHNREKRKEALEAEKQEKAGVSEEIEKLESSTTLTGTKDLIGAAASMKQVEKEGMVIARMEGGVAILKSEIRQDKLQRTDVEKKQEELKKREEKVRKASASRIAVLDKTRQEMRAAEQARIEKAEGKNKAGKERNEKDRVILKTTNFSREKKQEEQPQLHASITARK